ncbi:MAG: 23S rRNA (guanosine(2251)-2'-O)-methyltransferase RlmB [Bacteroidales bacterium]|nr:23S rRNA (guanosine(2251)-2'-O)-methyltransferase RlmB [Bacteroidales bacterium]MDD2280005.1 23S rRNA (guanosine(2251)-2'-O)-methyltransferase RlmB [Bacteroidales bacterium]MDD4292533.1 23S rRNA (guanosine(2251)-2'-O)-methyltransferase RlmB [Bacteroidales bacterium]MDD4491019.1 23S rRNA (guanosine(2251)-2'-O)-methyltransferase RlmB [Bacteroidales bacterium]NTU95252.1 23S rRNA (guanosine(2251)-2'-O)-methyltransferase RlmB [Bacteroidales bacterium]
MEQKNEYLFGMHPVIEALETNKKIEKVLFRQGMDGIQFHRLLQMLQEKDVPVQFVPEERLNRFTKGRHQGVVALISQVEYVSVETMVENALKRSELPLIILLDGVSDVRNFGAIARSAECAAADGIIVPAKGGAAINADAIKSSAGALLRIPTAKVPNLRTALYHLLEAGFQIVAATEKAEKTIYEVDFKKPTAIILGSEDKGISESVLAISTEVAKIPLMGKTLSLNVSVAASVVIFEALRQRIV